MDTLAIQNLDLYIQNTPILINFSATLTTGQCWGIVGRNGIGKSTFLNALLGLHSITKGQIIFNYQELKQLDLATLSQVIGLLEQEQLFFFSQSVRDTVLLASYPWKSNIEYHGETESELKAILETFYLKHLASKDIQHLSMGEKKRVAMALLKMQKPKIYLLDEPTNHLDIQYQLKLIPKFKSSKNITVIVSHDINLIERLCSHVLLIQEQGMWVAGLKENVLNLEYLREAFNTTIDLISHGTQRLWTLI